jgi:hypothetical protein
MRLRNKEMSIQFICHFVEKEHNCQFMRNSILMDMLQTITILKK